MKKFAAIVAFLCKSIVYAFLVGMVLAGLVSCNIGMWQEGGGIRDCLILIWSVIAFLSVWSLAIAVRDR